MYFKKLEIVGFKSFYNKTTLDFEPGITAIVGPNGCGKSNIFDSMRWVLGEQSVKALRGTTMEDVIFNGTEKKEALGMAEVTLTFDNGKRFFSVDHHEVAITRRLFRSGESEYLLNKAPVRLKDIQELLLGTGIGAESYSLIQQGKIDLVLSSRPEDRRLVFDEASGISKYKSQKRETMRRLEDTELNLARVNDIITEVKRQIGSLERQANKARKYRESFEELKTKELNCAAIQKKSLLAQKDEIQRNLQELEAAETKLLDEITTQETSIASHQAELKAIEEEILRIRNEVSSLENTTGRNREHIAFNKERIFELEEAVKRLETQREQTKARLTLDEEKLNSVRNEYKTIEQHVQEKSTILKAQETELATLTNSVKVSLEAIAQTKRTILDILSRISATKNEIQDAASRKHVHVARQKRLELERAKLTEETSTIEETLSVSAQEVAGLERQFSDLNGKINAVKQESEREKISLEEIKSRIENLEKQKISLQSQKEFLEQLKMKYEDIGESMNAMVYLDKLPTEKLSGLVIKISDYHNPGPQEQSSNDGQGFKISGEAKPIDLDTSRINERISQIESEIEQLLKEKSAKEVHTQNLTNSIEELSKETRTQEINLANKRTQFGNVQEQYNKLKNEQEILSLELTDVQQEIVKLDDKISVTQTHLVELDSEQKRLEDSILAEQNAIAKNNGLKETALVLITQVKTELEALQKRIESDAATLRILEDTYRQDQETMQSIETQIGESIERKESMAHEIDTLQQKIVDASTAIENFAGSLTHAQAQHQELVDGTSDVVKKIEADRTTMDALKKRLYELQMGNKDLDFKYMSIKERILQGYKIDIDTVMETTEGLEESSLIDEIQKLKDRVDSYGSVNLVAIEEYDELKKRYDFLTQQQTDLVNAKTALHEAILKINRTTRKMFLETFERVKVEFKNYFKLLFNGGDCQIYLMDEQDPLESGIEIICRPPGKKLQNILLLSGGEKSMAAIALIFAIFKVKPAPFCVLDEIDAALDEANVDRFGRLLQEFVDTAQFIVITHNKKTIANANCMYGITMEESGISKIVSVKFSQNKAKQTPAQEDTTPVTPVPA
ncbi:MAG TPA: AAA family ATPase [Candidatus Omnitrophota bacterium]|nr:AAA family ATPase [Candidatus Omnitrophota bacterium]